MARPVKCRFIKDEPDTDYFKPRGIPLRFLEEVNLGVDEYEALRLADHEGTEHEDAAKKMNVSRQTFGRILTSARKKIAEALVCAKAIKIQGGNFAMATRKFRCSDCGHDWELSFGTGRPNDCPQCHSANIHRAEEDRGYARRGGRMRKGPCKTGRGPRPA